MIAASPHVQTGTTELISRGSSHAYLGAWWWLLMLGMVLGLVVVASGVVLVARGRKNLTRPGRIAVAVLAVWVSVAATAVFLGDVRSGGDWGGGVFQAAVMVLYGLVGCMVVWTVDRTVQKLRRRPGLPG